MANEQVNSNGFYLMGAAEDGRAPTEELRVFGSRLLFTGAAWDGHPQHLRQRCKSS